MQINLKYFLLTYLKINEQEKWKKWEVFGFEPLGHRIFLNIEVADF